jgi:hypothetical protein
MKRSLPVALVVALLAAGGTRAGDKAPLELWLYYATNLLVDKNVDELEAIWRRAAAAGYSHVLLTDSKLAKLGDMDPRYFKNLERVKAIAGELELELTPALFGIGYSNDLLWHDANLAEGLPVRNALFVVKGGEARLVPDPPVAMREKFDWKDDAVTLAEGTATVRDPPGNARLVQKIAVARFRCYHVSVEVKTDGFTGEPELKVLEAAKGKPLVFTSLGVQKTQGWKTHHLVFNSLENEAVNVYFGVWGGAKGTLAWRKWKLEEVGLLNVLRRPGAPCVVQGKVEGKDYERIEDPHLGNTPWKGSYEVWHEPPVIRTRLADGTQLRVSWYHPIITHEEQVMICPSEPGTAEVLRDEAKRVREAFGARGYMMSFDEIRVLGWDESCARRKKAPGALLAESARECTKLLAGSQAYVWSDMFDPFHNAHDDYYLVRGDLEGSWEGLAPAVTVVNWNFEKRQSSLAFFAERGHKQVIAGYYDGDVGHAKEWLDAADTVKGVTGIMYTTWRHQFGDLEAFARVCRERR